MINEAARKDLIPDLDHFAEQANELKTELGYLIERHRAYKDASLIKVSNDAHALAASIVAASDELKRAGTAWIRSQVAGWYAFHYEDDDGNAPDEPTFESITYEGKDRWTIIISSPEHGRERIVVDSDASTWEQVYSANPA